MDESKLPKGEPPGSFGEIHLAARNRDAEKVAALLQAGVDPNVRNQREPNGDGGNTPLWFAAQGARPGGVPVARVLLDGGARIDERCEHGTTALHIAASWGDLDMVEFLVEQGADTRARDDEGATPLASMKACRKRMQADVARGAVSANANDWLAKAPPVIDFLSTCDAGTANPFSRATRRVNSWLFIALVIFALAFALAIYVWMQHVVRANGGVADPHRQTSLRVRFPERKPSVRADFALLTAAGEGRSQKAEGRSPDGGPLRSRGTFAFLPFAFCRTSAFLLLPFAF